MALPRKSLLAIALVALAATGAMFWWLARVRQSAGMGSFRYLPASSVVAAHIDLAGLRRSPPVRNALVGQARRQFESDYAEFVRATGFDFERDLDSVSLGLASPGGGPGSSGRTERNAPGGSQARAVQAVLEGRFDRARLESYSRDRRRSNSSFEGRSIDLFSGPSGRDFRLSFLDDGRLAFSNAAGPSSIENMIALASGGEPSLARRLGELRVFDHLPAGSQAWLAVDMERAGGYLSVPGGAISPGTSFSADLLRGSRMVLAAARIGEREVELRLVAECAGAIEARRVADSLSGLRALLGALAERDGRGGEPREVARALDRVSISVEKKTAVVRLSLDTALLERLLRESAVSARK